MTAEMRRHGEGSGVFFESTRSQCSRTPSTLEGGRGTSLRELLRNYLDCLVREIEQLLSSSTTFNTSFSWRLPRGLYPYAARGCLSSSSTECVELELPMKILDDLAVCKMRVLLRSKTPLETGVTPAEVRGKRTWSRLQGSLSTIVSDKVSSTGGRILLSYVERDVTLTARYANGSRTWSIVLRGRVDYAVLVHLNGCLFALLFEITEYKEAPRTVKHRLLAYTSALYGELGFPVIPVLLILGDQDKVEDLLVMRGKTLVSGIELKRAIGKLVRVLSAGEEVKPTSSEVCAVCDPTVRRMCPYAH